ncbi:MAG: hypothetical protein KKH61_20115 [Gammaproteobacteria bacterium]|nr:hypothetical protein [Gammaproteobacteria bacterium]
MHHHCEVWIPTNQNVEGQVEEVMEPYYEGNNPVEGFWDWYQIGGRWKGVHVPEYDQATDPDHLEACKLCKGTGNRPGWVYYKNGVRKFRDDWSKKCNGCNVCHGTGKASIWPTSWEPHPKDVIPISELPDGFDCYTLLLPKGPIHWEQGAWPKEPAGELLKEVNKLKLSLALERAEISIGYLVTVDYHS